MIPHALNPHGLEDRQFVFKLFVNNILKQTLETEKVNRLYCWATFPEDIYGFESDEYPPPGDAWMSGELNYSNFDVQMSAWNAVKKYKSKNKSSNQSDWYMVTCRDGQKEIFSYYMWVKYYCKLEAFASPSNGGSVLVNPNSIRETYTYGQGITFTSTATPLSGYRFIEWRDGSASGGQITANTQCNCTVPANSYDQSNPTKKIIYAIFKQLENKYGRLIVDYVSGSTSDMGSICANNSNTFVSDRKQVDFTITENQNGTWPSNPTGWAIATANSGYNFNGWFSDIGGTNSVSGNTSFYTVIACNSSTKTYRYYAKFSAQQVEPTEIPPTETPPPVYHTVKFFNSPMSATPIKEYRVAHGKLLDHSEADSLMSTNSIKGWTFDGWRASNDSTNPDGEIIRDFNVYPNYHRKYSGSLELVSSSSLASDEFGLAPTLAEIAIPYGFYIHCRITGQFIHHASPENHQVKFDVYAISNTGAYTSLTKCTVLEDSNGSVTHDIDISSDYDEVLVPSNTKEMVFRAEKIKPPACTARWEFNNIQVEIELSPPEVE